MSGQNGKGDDRRPMQISYAEWEKKYAMVFGKKKDARRNRTTLCLARRTPL
jgi:hypothetical protein